MTRYASENPPCQYLRDPTAFKGNPNAHPVKVKEGNAAFVDASITQHRYLHGLKRLWMPRFSSLHKFAAHVRIDEHRLASYNKGVRWLELDTVTNLNHALGPEAKGLWNRANAYGQLVSAPQPANPRGLTGFATDLDEALLSRPWMDPEPIREDHHLHQYLVEMVTESADKYDCSVNLEALSAWLVDPRIPLHVNIDQYGITASIPVDFAASHLVTWYARVNGDNDYQLSTSPIPDPD